MTLQDLLDELNEIARKTPKALGRLVVVQADRGSFYTPCEWLAQEWVKVDGAEPKERVVILGGNW